MNKLRRNRLTAAVHLTLLLALPGIAVAQDNQEENTLDTISITGTRINGDLQFDENVLPIAASDNTIGGNLQAVKNFGGLAFYRNIIASGFECKENAPAPVGGGNSASSKVDQCAGL